MSRSPGSEAGLSYSSRPVCSPQSGVSAALPLARPPSKQPLGPDTVLDRVQQPLERERQPHAMPCLHHQHQIPNPRRVLKDRSDRVKRPRASSGMLSTEPSGLRWARGASARAAASTPLNRDTPPNEEPTGTDLLASKPPEARQGKNKSRPSRQRIQPSTRLAG